MAKNYVEIGDQKVTRVQMGLGSLGNAGGLLFAYYKKKGFWGYVGFAIVGGIIGRGLGYLVSKPKDEDGK